MAEYSHYQNSGPMAKIPRPPKQRTDLCKVVTDKGFLFLTMPDGTIIPGQTKMTLENEIGSEDRSMVTITVQADTKFIKNRIEFLNVKDGDN